MLRKLEGGGKPMGSKAVENRQASIEGTIWQTYKIQGMELQQGSRSLASMQDASNGS